MAAPHVSAAAAMYIIRHSGTFGISSATVRSRIATRYIHVPGGWDSRFGNGILDMTRAIPAGWNPGGGTPPQQLTATVTANRVTGTTNDIFNFTVSTNFDATGVTLRFDGNPTVFTMNRTNSRSWFLNGNRLAAGHRTITVTATASDGRVATGTMHVIVNQPGQVLNVTVSANRVTGTTSDIFRFTATTNFDATSVSIRFDGNSFSDPMVRGANARTWTYGNTLRAGNRTVTVTATASDGRTATTTMNVTVHQATVQPLNVTVTANRTVGTTTDEFNFTATTNFQPTSVTLMFNGNPTVFPMTRINATTWVLYGNRLAVGNPRTITVTARASEGRTATGTINVTVNQPVVQPLSISVTANRTVGTTADEFNFTATPDFDPTSVELMFNGNPTVFPMTRINARTWVLYGNRLAVGNPRTITVTATASDGRTATGTMNVIVTAAIPTFTITFCPNDGGSEDRRVAQTVMQGEERRLEYNTFRRLAYTFRGWSITPDGSVNYVDGERISVNADKTLYAVWERQVTELSVDRLVGTPDDIFNFILTTNFDVIGVTMSVGETRWNMNMGENSRTWTLSKTFEEGAHRIFFQISHAGGTNQLSRNITVQAPKVFTITFCPNDGGSEDRRTTQTFIQGEENQLVYNTFRRSFYTFIGWSITPSGLVNYVDGERISVNADKILYAVWERQVIAISVDRLVGTPDDVFTFTLTTNFDVRSVSMSLDGTRWNMNMGENSRTWTLSKMFEEGTHRIFFQVSHVGGTTQLSRNITVQSFETFGTFSLSDGEKEESLLEIFYLPVTIISIDYD